MKLAILFSLLFVASVQAVTPQRSILELVGKLPALSMAMIAGRAG